MDPHVTKAISLAGKLEMSVDLVEIYCVVSTALWSHFVFYGDPPTYLPAISRGSRMGSGMVRDVALVAVTWEVW